MTDPACKELGFDKDRIDIPTEGVPDGGEQLTLSLLLRHKTTNVGEHQPLDWDDAFIADQNDIDLVRNYFESNHITVDCADSAINSIQITGKRAELERLFGITFTCDGTGNQVGYKGNLSLPDPLHQIVIGVTGLHSRTCREIHLPPMCKADGKAYTFKAIRERYKFPKNGFGKGETIAIITTGGGYYPEDLEQFWKMEGITNPPKVTYLGPNKPTARNLLSQWIHYWKLDVHGNPEVPAINEVPHWTYETIMNISVVSALAPEAEIYVFNLSGGTADATHQMVHFLKQAKPTVISGSFGFLENASPMQSTFNNILKGFVDTGGTACFACGNSGSNDAADKLAVNFPASSPHVVAVGGERIEDHGAETRYSKLWRTNLAGHQSMAGAGGFSSFFKNDLPWQAPYKTEYHKRHGHEVPPGRAMPDISMLAENDIGPRIICNGEEVTSGGTSLATQLTAALFLCLRSELTARDIRPMHLNRKIYSPGVADAIAPPTQPGNNWVAVQSLMEGPYTCDPDDIWSPCVGLGSPDGEAMLDALIKCHQQDHK